MRRAREGFRGLNKRLHRLFEVSRVLPLACAPGQQNPQSKNPFEARPFYRTCRQSRNQLNGLAPLNNPCAEAKKRHHAHWNYFRTTPRYPRPPAGVCATTSPQATAFAARSASSRPIEPPHCACAGPERGSSMPHGTQGVCRACRMGTQTETPPKQAALARQVRQRMNRLGKPEHRARFCFFSKKKSLAGMRRFLITLKIQIQMGFNRSATSLAALKLFLISPTRGRCLHHHARRNYRRTAARHPRPPAGTKRRCPWNFALLCAQSRVLGFRASGFAGCSRFLGFASRLRSRTVKPAKQELF